MAYFDDERGTDLKAAFDDLVRGWVAVTEKRTFGCPSYSAEETLFAVLVTDGVVLTRLPSTQRDALSRSFDAGPFQAGDRTVTSWVQVTVGDVGVLDDLRPYVTMSYEVALEESGDG